MRSTLRVVLLGLTVLLTMAGCAGEEQDQIRLQANAVGGGQVYYEDLASEDTVLWFWAPW